MKTPKQREKDRLKKIRLEARAVARKDKAKLKKETKILPTKADILWSKVVRLKWACEVCWKTENLNAHHIFSRHNKSVRWDVDNWICLCPGCHVFSDTFSAHKTPTDFTFWLEKQYSREYLEILWRKANTPLHVSSEYLKLIISNLQSKL